jgi:glycosyltransferase involved in cell wall biosynthesis
MENQKAPGAVEFSVVIPLYNEEENVKPLHAELVSVLSDSGYELVYVDDGSTDKTLSRLKEELRLLPVPYAKIIEIPVNLGQSFAFKIGMDNSNSSVVVFMDADLQNDPRDIPFLVSRLKDGYALAQGVRVKRKDSFFRKILPSVAANFILRVFCGSKFSDIGCSLKAFRKETAEEMTFQQGMHRMLPVYFCLKKCRVLEVAVNHRKRLHGKTKYGFYRTLEVVFEIIKINFFEKNSNTFLFLTDLVAGVIFAYAAYKGFRVLPVSLEQAAVYLIICVLSFYVFVISTALYISRSFYAYHKNISGSKSVKVNCYNA